MVHPVIAQAIEFNANCEGAEEYWNAEAEAQVLAGTPKIYVTTQAPGLGWVIRITAYVGVELPNGKHAAACDPVMVKVNRKGKGGMTSEKAAQWWARKNFGKDLPIRTNHLV